jgi:hypothetical protein
VGLRPGRTPARLDEETLRGSDGEQIKVIHAYGHGGSGITLGYGVATDLLNKHFACWYEQKRGTRSNSVSAPTDASKLSSWYKFRSKL